MKMPRRGFTLLEMVIALAVFAVIGVMSSRIIAGMIDMTETTRSRGEALADVQRALTLIQRDIEQMTHRPVRDAFDESDTAISVGDAVLLELTRLGWQNPLGAPRSELQRVAYALVDDRLVRLFWPVLDRAPDTEPVPQVLLTGVVEAAFAVRDEGGEKRSHWPLPETTASPGDAAQSRLAAIELGLELKLHGRIERLWLVPEAKLRYRPGDAATASPRPGEETPDDPDASP